MDKLNLRQVFCAQNPVLPQWLKPRRLRGSSSVEMGRKKGSSDRTSFNPDDGHRLDSGSITLNRSPQNSVDQPEASHASVCLHEKTPEIDISLTPLHANTAEFSPPVSEQENNSDRASTRSSHDRASEELVVTIERSQDGELADLQEEVEALKAMHLKEILAANSKKLELQKRVKKLLGQISTNNHRQGNVRLCNFVASLSSENEESNADLETAHSHRQQLESELSESLELNCLVAKNLQRACRRAEFYRNRMYQLNYALEKQPGKYADVDREIKLKDQRYSDLELRAGDSLTAMSEVEKKCTEDHEADCAKVAEFKIRLPEQDADIASLKASKASLQQNSEEIFEMLAGRVSPSALHDAMNEYFQLVIEDNDVLKKKFEDQLVEISRDRDKAKLLSHDNRSLKTSNYWTKRCSKTRFVLRTLSSDVSSSKLTASFRSTFPTSRAKFRTRI